MSPHLPAATALAGTRLVGASPTSVAANGAGYVAQPTTYRTMDVDGLSLFYREAGDPASPTILLLHGFPSSSHMFRDLLPLLAAGFHLVAPDYPGFGHSAAPSADAFTYTFDHLADVIERFVDALALDRYSLYVHDYGAPVGFRLATRRPQQVTALIVQNGLAYVEGVTDLSRPIATFGEEPRNAETEQPLRDLLKPEGTIFQYTTGVADPARLSPDAWTMDQLFLDRPGNDQIQLALFHDYRSNVKLYPDWQAYFREHQPPTLVVWGKNDPFFGVPAVKAMQRDLPEAEVHLLDTGHFALEDHADEIACHIRRFLTAHVGEGASS
jgi:pimeloyl-ACP methyl ester carboxylesterase